MLMAAEKKLRTDPKNAPLREPTSRLARARALVASAPTRGMAGTSGRRGQGRPAWGARPQRRQLCHRRRRDPQQEFAQEVAFEGDKRNRQPKAQGRDVIGLPNLFSFPHEQDLEPK